VCPPSIHDGILYLPAHFKVVVDAKWWNCPLYNIENLLLENGVIVQPEGLVVACGVPV
jgi:Zn-finger protein